MVGTKKALCTLHLSFFASRLVGEEFSIEHYFSTEISGRVEAVFMVKAEKAEILSDPSEGANVMSSAKENSYVHALSLQEGFVQVDLGQWMRRVDLLSLGGKTEGLQGLSQD